MITAILDHLWQSTLFAGAAGVVTLLLRANAARVRFWLWFAGSVKFLVPFAALAALGARLLPQAQAPVLDGFAPMAEPFVVPAANTHALAAMAVHPVMAAAPAAVNWSGLLFAVWALGTLAVVSHWLSRWLKLNVALSRAGEVSTVRGVAVRVTPEPLEPGLFGIWRPVILLPQGIEERLSPAELDAVLAHETCHRAHRDNLWAAIHMLVEALFWFHPLVWWLGARLNHEREQACDEAVVAAGQVPDIYAESILKVCKLYVHSPLPCVSGVSGADLKDRLERIVVERVARPLGAARKTLLAGLAAGSLIVPLSLGLLTAPPAELLAVAQTADAPHAGTGSALRRQIDGWERKQPVLEDMTPTMIALSKQQQVMIQTMIDGWGALKSITFKENDAGGGDVYLVEFQNGSSVWTLQPLQDGKIAGMSFQPTYKRTDKGPSPGLEADVRRYYEGLLKKAPAYDIMGLQLIAATPPQLADLEQDAKNLGALKTLTFSKINAAGWDVYAATYDNGTSNWRARPLTDGKLNALWWYNIRLPNAPAHPGTEASLRRYIESLEKGQPNYDDMAPGLAATVKLQLPEVLAAIRTWGGLKSIAFKGGGSRGVDIYEVTFERGKAEWSLAPLTLDGKVERRGFRPLS